MKRTIPCLALVLLIVAALPLAASEVKQREGFSAEDVVRRTALTPTSDSELTLGDIAVVDFADGTSRLRLAYQLTADQEHFFYKVDLANKTYTAWRPDSGAVPQAVRERFADRAAKNRFAIGADDIYDPPPNCGLPQGPTFEPCDSPCSGDSNAVLTLYDGAWNWLADTEGNLKYRRGGFNGCRWTSFMNGHCWANSNAGGKIWYSESCSIYTAPPFYDGGSGSIEGRYYNTNGGNQSLRTNARHFLRIDYAAPATWVYYEYSVTGEAYTTFIQEFFAWQNGYCDPY